MLGRENLKALFHDVMEKRPSLKDINSFDTLLVQTHHTLQDHYGNQYNKGDSKEIALCIWFNYSFLYK